MKYIVAIVIIALSHVAQAKTTVLYAETAREVMQALASAGFKVNNIDQNWTDVTLNIKAKNITCVKSKTQFPDDWNSGTLCHTDSTELKNPILLMKTLKPYAATLNSSTEDILEVKSLDCFLTTPKDSDEWKTYMCVVNTIE